MLEAALLASAALCSYCGMAWFALAKASHWEQVGRARSLRPVGALNVLGSVSVVASLLLCLRVDHASMAALVWVMMSTAAALLVTFTLAWRPRWLAWLVVWSG